MARDEKRYNQQVETTRNSEYPMLKGSPYLSTFQPES
jgi:hypothetical protein